MENERYDNTEMHENADGQMTQNAEKTEGKRFDINILERTPKTTRNPFKRIAQDVKNSVKVDDGSIITESKKLFDKVFPKR